jgi:gluconokinase
MNKLFIVMGVSGTGKTTIGKLLSETLDIPFFDGDDFHPKSNITKMASGLPLNDEDRYDWLVALNQLLKTHQDKGAIVACSALKKAYRTILSDGISKRLYFIYLQGSFEEVKSRLEERKGHFMPLELLKSQFDTLEEPKNAITVSIMRTPNEIVREIVDRQS